MRSKLPTIIAFLFLLFFIVGWIIFSLGQPFKVLETPKNNQPVTSASPNQSNLAWVQSMSSQEQKSYIYPASEMTLKYNFDKGVEPLRVFINDLNEYRFYCISQVLLEEKVEYAYYKTAKAIRLIVFLEDAAMRDKVLADFDYYKIPYSF